MIGSLTSISPTKNQHKMEKLPETRFHDPSPVRRAEIHEFQAALAHEHVADADPLDGVLAGQRVQAIGRPVAELCQHSRGRGGDVQRHGVGASGFRRAKGYMAVVQT